MNDAIKASFAPETDRTTRVLILGSLPGERSLQMRQYYANPRNQFWRLVGAVIGEVMPDDYALRLQALRRHRIGLWDVVRTARRTGSLDANIRHALAQPLADFATTLPDLRAIAFNGAKAAALGRKQFGGDPRWPLLALPSSSPAHAIGFERKLAAWRALEPHLADGTGGSVVVG